MYNGLFEPRCIELDERIHLTRNGSSNVNNEGTMMPSMFTVVSWLPVPLV